MKADGLVDPDVKVLSAEEAKKLGKFVLHMTPTEKDGLKMQFANEEEPDRIPTFYAPGAYNGGPIFVDGWDRAMIVDLGGLRLLRGDFPVRFQHKADYGVGHTTKCEIVDGKRFSVEGQISRKTKYAEDVIESAKAGFPWSVSIGILVMEYEDLPAGKSVEVNGRAQAGPAYIVRDAVFGELSFVDIGADLDARAYVMAHGSTADFLGDDPMKASLTEPTNPPAPSDNGNPNPNPAGNNPAPVVPPANPAPLSANLPSNPPVPAPVNAGLPNSDDVVAKIRNDVAAERERISKIEEICASHPAVMQSAIREGWDISRATMEVELATLRAARPTPPAIHGAGGGSGAPALTQVLEAACCLAGGLQRIESHFGANVLSAARDRFKNGVGLQELIMECAWANGYSSRVFNRDREGALCAASANGQRQFRVVNAAGLSSISVSGILSNVANKFLLDGFMSVERVWPQISKRLTVNDFKVMTMYRLTGKEKYEKIAPGGEIRHGTLGEESFTIQADSYGLLLSVDRRDIINDDLGAISAVPQKLGRGAGLKFNEVFWNEFLDDSAFFTSGNSNLIDDQLEIDGLTQAEIAFMDFEDPEGNPLGGMPTMLLVPPQLMTKAGTIFSSTEIWPAIDVGDRPVNNPHANKYQPVMSRYLKAHPTAWYLLGSPSDLPVIGHCFLNGNENPTIETADADFNTLGIQMRGYHDFGVALQDTRGGVKSDGTGA